MGKRMRRCIDPWCRIVDTASARDILDDLEDGCSSDEDEESCEPSPPHEKPHDFTSRGGLTGDLELLRDAFPQSRTDIRDTFSGLLDRRGRRLSDDTRYSGGTLASHIRQRDSSGCPERLVEDPYGGSWGCKPCAPAAAWQGPSSSLLAFT